MKASFFQRFGAYILDIVFVTIIIGMFTGSITQSKKYEELTEKSQQLIEDYSNKKIEADEYLKEVEEINYQLDKESSVNNIIGLVISILYYVVFQYLNKGQTVGKKLTKIKIKAKDGELKPQAIVIRALIINSIFSSIILLGTINFLNQSNYTILKTTLSGAETIFIIASAFMILYRKDKLALQDIITKTEVVKEG